MISKLILVFISILISGALQLGNNLVKAAPINLIPNESVEIASSSNSQLPQSWNTGRWGTNSTTFSYLTTGHNGGRSISVRMTSYTNGDAKWYFNPVNVTAGDTYTYSDYYMSDINAEVLAAFIDSNGNYTYKYLGTSAASSSEWKQYTKSFIIPSGITKLTIYHMIYSTGSLRTDDYSLTKISNEPSTPNVSITSLNSNQTVSGIVDVTVNASDANGINNVQFKLDGQNLGLADFTSPYSYRWDTTKTSNGSHTLSAVATNTQGQTAVASPVAITVNNPTENNSGTELLPNNDLEIVDPANSGRPLNWRSGKWGTNTFRHTYLSSGRNSGHCVKTEITQYTSGAAYWYNLDQPVTPGKTYTFSDYYQSNIMSEIDIGVNMSDGTIRYIYLGSPAASPSSWTKYTKQFVAPPGAVSITIYHEIFGVGWLTVDDYSLTENDQTQVSITGPSSNETVSGDIDINATATDSKGISSVQFKIDGTNIGAPDTTAPYSYSLDTKNITNGSHTLTATAMNTSGLSATSAALNININNQPVSLNLMSNPSLEQSASSGATKPTDWTGSKWGTNSTTFSYLDSGHNGTRSIKAEMTQFSSGSAHWYSKEIPVTPGQTYDYSNFYMSNVTTQIIAAYKMSDGSTKYVWLGSPASSPNGWTQFKKQFVAPDGAVSMYIYHELYSVGWVTSDDYYLAPSVYVGFKNPIISITVDDGFSNLYTNGLPLLKKYGFNSTDYIITDNINEESYLTSSMVRSLYTSGHEIASHTLTHPDLSFLTASQLNSELADSQTYLENLIGGPVPNFASPYGSYSQSILDAASIYYRSFRTVSSGYNAKNNFNRYQILVQNLHSDTTLEEFKSWVNQAKATNTWLVLVYHQFSPSSATGTYNTYPSDFDAQLNILKNSGVPVRTVNQALDELIPQL